jgi:DNA gyrase subunit B
MIAQPPLYKVKKGKKEKYLKDDAALENHLILLGSEETQVIGTGADVPLAGEVLANVLRRFSRLEHVLEVIERGGRQRAVVSAAAEESRLGPEAFRDTELLAGIARRLEERLRERGDVEVVGVEIVEPEPGELPVISIATGKPAAPHRTLLSLEFCASPEFEETRRLTNELSGAGRAPFTVESGNERIAMPTLSAAVRHVMASARKGLEIQRYKGLGEMNPEQLWDTTMNPETRTLLEVRVDDMPEAERIFSTLMGDAVEPRRQFIEAHARSARNLDI